MSAQEAPMGDREADLLALQRFVVSVFGDFPEHGDIDGFTLQEIAVACGLLKCETVMVPCGENCQCAAYDAEGLTVCYRTQPVLQRAHIAAAPQHADAAKE